MPKQKKKQKEQLKPETNFFDKIDKKYVYFVAVLVLLIPLLVTFSPYLFENLRPVGTDIVASKGQTNLYLEWQEETGERALWNPFVFSGMPTYHRISPRIIHIDSLISLLDGFSYWAFFYFVAGGLGIFSLLYYKKIPWQFALIAAVAFTLLTDWQAQLGDGHFTKLRAAMALPWLILTFSYFFDKNNWFGAAAFSLVFAWMFRTQHFQIVFYGILILFVLYIYPFIKLFLNKQYSKVMSLSIKFAAAIILTVITAAQPFLSMREYAPYSTRGGNPLEIGENYKTAKATGGVDLEYATKWSLAPAEIMDFFIQRFHGGISAEVYDGDKYPQLKGQQVPGYWGQKPFSGNYHYFGMILFLFAVLGIAKNYKDPFVSGLSAFVVLSLLLSFGRHFIELYQIFYYVVPYFSKFRAPSIIANVTFIALIILSGYGIKSLFQLRHPRDTKLLVSLFGSAIVLAAAVLLFKDSFSYIGPNEAGRYKPEQLNLIKDIRKEFLAADTLKLLIMVVLTTGASLAFYFRKIKGDAFTIILFALVLIELFPANRKAAEKIDLKEEANVEARVFAENELTAYLEGRSITDRLLVLGREFQSNHYSYFHPTINGYSAIKTQLIQDINEHALYNANTAERINWNVINMLGGKYIIADGLINGNFLERAAYSQSANQVLYENKNALPKAWFVESIKNFSSREDVIFYMNDTLFNPVNEALIANNEELASKSFPAEGNIQVTEYTPNKISFEVATTDAQFMVVSEVYYPAGWNAYVNGELVTTYQVNHILRGIEIPAGENSIEFVFESSTYNLAITLSWFGNLVVLILLIVSLVNYFRSQKWI